MTLSDSFRCTRPRVLLYLPAMRRLVLALRKEESLSFIIPFWLAWFIKSRVDAQWGAVLLPRYRYSPCVWALGNADAQIGTAETRAHKPRPQHHSSGLPRCLRAITFRAEDRNYELPSTMLKQISASFIRYIRGACESVVRRYLSLSAHPTSAVAVVVNCILHGGHREASGLLVVAGAEY